MTILRSRVWAVILVASAATCFCAPEAHAVLKVAAGGEERTIDANCDIQPNAAGDPFFAQVQACLDELTALGKDGYVKSLINSSHTHTISKTNGGSHIDWDEDPDAEQAANGAAGSGADTNIKWNPTNAAFPNGYTRDGTPRDPCGALLHELVHSNDADQGLLILRKMNTTSGGSPTKVLIEEVRACQVQNWMSEAKGMPSRTKYGNDDLPKGVLFDRCPDCIILFFNGFQITLDGIVYEVPVGGLGRPNNPAMNVPGRRYEVRDGSNTLRGYVTPIKDLDGNISFRLTAVAGQSMTLTNVQFKNNGATIGPNLMYDNPVTVDATNPSAPLEAETEAIDPPPIGALRINKCGDAQSITQGQMITWKIKVTNIGDVPLMNVTVTDTFPGCNFTIANLDVGATEERECTVTPAAAGSFTNQAQGQGQGPNNEAAQSMDTAKYTVKSP